MRKISEGGAAIGGKRIPKHRVQDTIIQYKHQVLSLLNISQWGPIGSTGKKESNGDIDLAIESPMTLDEIKKILDDAGIRNISNKGLGEINTEFSQYEGSRETEDTVQVDLMIGDFSWLNFIYVGYSENDTKYKPLTRTALLYAILRVIPETINEDGSVDFYSISPNRGFFRKNGKETPSGFKSKRVDSSNNNSPEELASLTGLSVEELVLPFEKLWNIARNTFSKEDLIKIADYVKNFLTAQKLPIPSELQSKLTEASVAHMVHLEDLVYEGKGEKMFAYLHDMFDTLKGNTTKARTTVKIDGSPMIAMANNFPGVDGPFVGMKNIFAKVPQIFQNAQQIEEKYGHIPDLSNKLMTALRYADKLGIPDGEIWKGDFLFTSDDIKIQTDEGKKFVTFKPNQIVYAIEKGSELGERVLQSDIGIVFHTIHRGDDIKSSETNVSYDVDISRLTVPETAFILDANLPSLAGTVFLTENETKIATDQIAQAENIFETLKSKYSDILQPNSVQQGLLNKFENQAVRTSTGEDQFFGDPNIYIDKFIDWFSEKFDKESLQKKTEKGRESTIARKNALIEYFQSNEGFYKLIALQQIVVQLKKLFIGKLENLSSMTPYEELPDGSLKITSHEGFAVSDIDGNIIKFVDRLVFSKKNLLGHNVKENVKITPSFLILSEKEREMKEDYKTDLKNDAEEFIKDLDLNPKKITVSPKSKRVVPDIDNVKATVQPNKKMSRGDAAKDVLGNVDPEKVISKELPTGGRRPVIILNNDTYTMTMEFKPAQGFSSSIDAKQTKAMESWWMYFMYAKLNGLAYPTIEEVAEDFTKVDIDWYEGFISGAESIYSFLKGDTEYIFSREDHQIPKSPFPAIHEMIDSLFKKRRDVFGTIGSKKDAWNPSDLYIIHKIFVKEFIRTWESFETKEDLTLREVNDFLSDNLKEKNLIGVSLKKLTQSANPSLDIIDSSSEPDKAPQAFELEKYFVPMLLPSEPGRTSSGGLLKFSVDGSPVIGAYRFFGESRFSTRFCGALQLELKKPGSKAQLGKLPSSITKLLLERYSITFLGKKEKQAFLINKDPAVLNDLLSIAEKVETKGFSNITRAGIVEYFDKLFRVDFQDESTTNKEDYIHAGFLTQAVYFSQIFAEAVERNEINFVLKLIYEGAAKTGDDNAPYIKLS